MCLSSIAMASASMRFGYLAENANWSSNFLLIQLRLLSNFMEGSFNGSLWAAALKSPQAPESVILCALLLQCRLPQADAPFQKISHPQAPKSSTAWKILHFGSLHPNNQSPHPCASPVFLTFIKLMILRKVLVWNWSFSVRGKCRMLLVNTLRCA